MGSNVPPMTPSRFPIERHPTAGLAADRSGAEPSFEVDDVLRVSGGDIERLRQREPGAVQLLDRLLLGSVRPLAYPIELTGRFCEPRADVEHHVFRRPSIRRHRWLVQPEIGRASCR